MPYVEPNYIEEKDKKKLEKRDNLVKKKKLNSIVYNTVSIIILALTTAIGGIGYNLHTDGESLKAMIAAFGIGVTSTIIVLLQGKKIVINSKLKKSIKSLNDEFVKNIEEEYEQKQQLASVAIEKENLEKLNIDAEYTEKYAVTFKETLELLKAKSNLLHEKRTKLMQYNVLSAASAKKIDKEVDTLSVYKSEYLRYSQPITREEIALRQRKINQEQK